MTATTKLEFEALYDRYSPMINGIALQIAPTPNLAKQLLITTFIRAHLKNIQEQQYPPPCFALIKLLIQTANEKIKNSSSITNLKFRLFENSPMLQYLVCEQSTLEIYCVENKIPKEEAGKKLRSELKLLITSEKESQFLLHKMELSDFSFANSVK